MCVKKCLAPSLDGVEYMYMVFAEYTGTIVNQTEQTGLVDILSMVIPHRERTVNSIVIPHRENCKQYSDSSQRELQTV